VKRRVRAWLSARAFDSVIVSRVRNRRHVLCLGDSHLRVFAEVDLPGTWFRVFYVRGATASGIQNPNSATNARARFEEALGRAKRWQHLLIGLGEVDCNFIIWRRAEQAGTTAAAQLPLALDAYTQFLEEVAARGFASVTALSATLPTIEDYQALERQHPNFDPEVMGFRSQIRVSYEERARLTEEFNLGVAQRCAELGIGFVDTTVHQLDPSTGRVREDLLFEDLPDIHLQITGYAALLRDVLAERGFPQARSGVSPEGAAVRPTGRGGPPPERSEAPAARDR
jgi:hypothetical protein